MPRQINTTKRLRPNKPALCAEPLPATRMQQLVIAAEQTFLDKGYHAATMSDVAAAAGMSKKTVYQLIESKEQLFGMLLAYREESLTFPVPRPEWTARQTLIQHMLCLARFLLSPQQISILRLIMGEYTHSPDLGRVFHQTRVKRAKHRLETCLLKVPLFDGMKAAELREISALLFGMALGEFQIGVLLGFRAPPSKTVLEQRVTSAVDIVLKGHPGIVK
jgi:TetR/AcrR family transcriptional repressor of mexJK operon